MKLRLLAFTALGCALYSIAGEPAAPAPESKPDANPAPPLVSADGKIVIEFEENGKKETRTIDLNDPASAASIQGKAVITTEINGKRETRIVDLKDVDKMLPPFIYNEKPPVRTGPVTFLGVATMEVPRDVSAQLTLPPETGLLVVAVAPDSPAAAAGLLECDVLSKLDDQILITQRQLAVLIANHKEGDAIKLTYYRKGQPMEASATLRKREAPAPMENPAPFSTVTRHVIKFGDGSPADESSIPGILEKLPPELRPRVEKLLKESLEQRKTEGQARADVPPPAPAKP